MKQIRKIGLAVIRDGHLLVLRKKKGRTFILPGGKPEEGEDDLTALVREIREELGCEVEGPRFARAFTATAADMENVQVTVVLYEGDLKGDPHPLEEIEEMAWTPLNGRDGTPLATSISEQIMPYLLGRT